MKLTAAAVFQPVRDFFNKPIGVTSMYRTKELNEKIGGASSSQHTKGEAIDIDADVFDNGITNKEIFDFINTNLDYDQLIWEFGDKDEPAWVHVSYKADNPELNRRRKLRAYKDYNNDTKYEPM